MHDEQVIADIYIRKERREWLKTLEGSMTPSDDPTVSWRLKVASNAALERAAKVCDRIAGEQGECAQVAYDCGDAVRALKT